MTKVILVRFCGQCKPGGEMGIMARKEVTLTFWSKDGMYRNGNEFILRYASINPEEMSEAGICKYIILKLKYSGTSQLRPPMGLAEMVLISRWSQFCITTFPRPTFFMSKSVKFNN